ncbi:hypothetical protein EDC14_1004200 [Hydrogenispora ethanolica]|uniref:Uncharacterized protein n=1 Tax=Hydrogenispora ethanolica TaxID=1082276 RepID=A0A4R1S717_HYDET|nr:hypothetical protein EDC14_1004200 [Hydrogenispora ethanolica]
MAFNNNFYDKFYYLRIIHCRISTDKSCKTFMDCLSAISFGFSSKIAIRWHWFLSLLPIQFIHNLCTVSIKPLGIFRAMNIQQIAKPPLQFITERTRAAAGQE